MVGYAIAVSGAIGSGKSALAKALAERLGARRISFGDEVRRYVEQDGGNRDDNAVLQQVGQALVLSDLVGFVARVLAQADAGSEPDVKDLALVVEGVRHVEVLIELKRRLGDGNVFLVHLDAPTATRERRLMERLGIDRRLAARYDADMTEAQVLRILPQYADRVVDGDLPTALQVSQVAGALERWTRQPLGSAA